MKIDMKKIFILVSVLFILGFLHQIKNNHVVFAQTPSCQSDLNKDGVVNDLDFNILRGEYGMKCSILPSPTSGEQKQLRIYDANNQEMGILMNFTGNIIFFNTTVNKVITLVGGNQMSREDVWYQTNDCSGTAYRSSSVAIGNEINTLFSAAPDRYFVINPTNGVQHLTLHSLLRWNGELNCLVSTENNDFVQLDPVTLPFTEPAAAPLLIKYQ